MEVWIEKSPAETELNGCHIGQHVPEWVTFATWLAILTVARRAQAWQRLGRCASDFGELATPLRPFKQRARTAASLGVD
eukprot:5715622-Prymnesium_polylepis.1